MKVALRWTHAPLVLALVSASARAQLTERVSVGSGGVQANSLSERPSISDDGRFVAFTCAASNLVAGDTNGARDVFVHDRLTGTTERVSVSTSGTEGNGRSEDVTISADGRFVAFDSEASNLVLSDVNTAGDVFVRDRQTGTTSLVSVATGGTHGDFASGEPSISADGRFVAFSSDASNLVAGDTNLLTDIFVRDIQTGTTERVSVATGGTQANSGSGSPRISADGRFVVFKSHAWNLVVGDTNGLDDVFVHDRVNGTTELVSVSSSGAQGNDISILASISDDGRFVAFTSWATNFVAGDVDGSEDVFVRDRQSGTTELVTGVLGVPQGGRDPVISADGRYVAFDSPATSLVAGDTNGHTDAFVLDRQSGTMERASVATSGVEGNSESRAVSMSPDGRCVAFSSQASNFVTGDTNGWDDIFVRDRGSPTLTTFCYGDGSGTACPCGNVGLVGHGCGSSIHSSGAHLAATGNASIGADTLLLLGTEMPDSSALYFQGTSQVSGGAGLVFGDGLRCAGGTILRLGAKLNVAGASQYPVAGDASVSVRGHVTSPGIRTCQVWYRNAAAFCTPFTFNLTNGIEVQWSP